MASSQSWEEYNGSGCTESAASNGLSYMSTDAVETGTLYQSNPVASNSNSYVKYEALKFTVGSGWNNLSAASYVINNNSQASGLSVVANFNVSPYATPVSTALGGASAFQTTASTAAKFGGTSFTTGSGNTTGPFVASGSQTTTASGGGTVYLMAFASQLQVSSGYTTPGNMPGTTTITASWTES